MSSSSTDGANKVQRAGVAEIANVDERCNKEHLERVKEGLSTVAKDLCGRLDPRSGVVPFVLMQVRMCCM